MRGIWLFLFSAQVCLADPTPTAETLTHESEASVVLASGNSDTQTFSVKQSTGYTWDENTGKFFGSFLLGKSGGADTAKKWDLGIRYDRLLFGSLGAFAGFQLDSNVFAGTELRHTVDLGGKITLLKTDVMEILSEVGYRLTAEKFTADNGATSSGELTSHISRIYVAWAVTWNEGVSSNVWVEYLQSFTHTSDSRINLEPSLSVLLSNAFSLKLAYLVNYRNIPAVAGKKQLDTLYTTSLVAKF